MDLKINNNAKLRFAPFTQLEYIESTGTQWIDTGITPTNNTKLQITFTYTDLSAQYNCPIGGRGTGSFNDPCFGITKRNNALKLHTGLDNVSDTISPNINTEYNIILNARDGKTILMEFYTKVLKYQQLIQKNYTFSV